MHNTTSIHLVAPLNSILWNISNKSQAQNGKDRYSYFDIIQMERSYSLSCKTTIYIANLFVFEGINYVEHLYKNPNLQHQSFIYAGTNYVQFLFIYFFYQRKKVVQFAKEFWSMESNFFF